jgi:predicted nucleic acid-binding Zn ribbon protein
MICPHCQQEIPDGTRFCSKCRAQLDAVTPSTAKRPVKLMILGFFIPAIGIILAAINLCSKTQEKKYAGKMILITSCISLALSLVGLIIIGSANEGTVTSPSNTNTAAVATTAKPHKKQHPPRQKVDKPWTAQPLSVGLVQSHLDGVNGILKVEVQSETGEVSVILDEKNAWDDTAIVQDIGLKHIDIAKALFTHPAVKRVTTYASTEMVDQYGKSSVERVASVSWPRSVHQKIDYANFANLDTGFQSFNVADSYWIHPGVWKNIDKKDKLNGLSIKVE